MKQITRIGVFTVKDGVPELVAQFDDAGSANDSLQKSEGVFFTLPITENQKPKQAAKEEAPDLSGKLGKGEKGGKS